MQLQVPKLLSRWRSVSRRSRIALLALCCASMLCADFGVVFSDGVVTATGVAAGGSLELFAEVGSADPPPVIGQKLDVDGVPGFKPKYPLAAGMTYRATYLDPSGASHSASFSIPKPTTLPSTQLDAIYPTTSLIPENQLKFYFQFSAPMGRGEAYQHVHLEDPEGKRISLPFLELDQELWDPSGTRLTIFFDPGRVKRGLLPMEEAGVPVEEGKSYKLVVSEKWRDAEGLPLTHSFIKPFRVTAPDRDPPETSSWVLVVPKPGSRQALEVQFPEPMDRGLLARVIEIETIGGEVVAGSIAIDRDETRWRFTPDEPWKAGRYYLAAAVYLEDLAGNSIERPFEVDIFEKVEERIERKQARVEFEVR